MLDSKGVRNGLLFGGTTLALGLLLYLINKEFFLNTTLRLVSSFVLPVFFMRKAILEEREERNGEISFSEAIQPAYLTLIIGVVIFSIFQYIIMTADFELLVIQKEIAVSSIESISGFAGLTEENIAQVREMEAEDLAPNVQSLFLGLAKNFILGFILAAITAAVLKKQALTND